MSRGIVKGTRERTARPAGRPGVRQRERLEEEIELHYSSLGTAEREDDAAWAELAGRSLGESWT